MIYFDNAATTLHKPQSVARAMTDALESLGNSGRGAHGATLDASRSIYSAREKVARLFHISDPARIAFTGNATEALNTAIYGLFQKADHVITTVCEHNSVLRPLYRMEEGGTAISFLTADSFGRIRYEELEKKIRKNTKGIVITHASNLTGNITDLECVSKFAKKNRLFLVVDASQSAGAVPIDVEKDGIDVLCFTGHKGLMGPQGTGGIYVREGMEVRPLKVGGSGIRSFDRSHPSVMPTALEAGTLNGVGIAGLSASLSFLLETGVENIREREISLARKFTEGISDIAGVRLYGDPDWSRRTAIVSLNLGNLDSAELGDWLWEDYGIAVRTGAHCAPLMHESLGTKDQGAVRFSFSWFNTEDEVERAIEAMHTFAKETDS